MNRWLAFIFRLLCTAIALSIALAAIGWLIGRVLSDRYMWSQWLWWIPTPLVLIAMIIGLACVPGAFGSRRIRRHLATAWIVCGAAMFMFFAVIEHRLLRREPNLPAGVKTLKVAHWNVQPPRSEDVPPSVEILRNVKADVIIVTDPGGPFPPEQNQALADDGYQVVTNHPFALLSRVPVISMRTVVFVDQMHVVVVELDARESLGEVLTMYLIDLPSNPQLPRIEVAGRVRAMLHKMSLPAADLVIGDFNLPRGSASIATLFPSMRHAFNQSGHGYGATYPRDYPLWHIDHMLLGPSLRALRYDIIDPGRSRHRLQVAWIDNTRSE